MSALLDISIQKYYMYQNSVYISKFVHTVQCFDVQLSGPLCIISFLTMEYWNQTLQYILKARGILHSTLPREYTD